MSRATANAVALSGQDDEALRDGALSLDFPLGVELEVFLRREDAERFIAEVRGDDPEFGSGDACHAG